MTDSSSSTGDLTYTGERLDALFAALADERCRQVVRYFETVEGDVASVDEIVSHTVESETGSSTSDQLELMFHHIVLPKLADKGIVEYDARSCAVKYCGPSILGRILTVVDEEKMTVE